MKTECVRCHKSIDTVQGYKFSPNEYVCMACYDEYKKERVSRAKKQHKNPLIDQFGEEGAAARRQTPPPLERTPESPPSPPAQPAPPRPEMRPGPDLDAPSLSEERMQTPSSTQAPSPPQAPSTEELCDVCKKPVSDFKIPLRGGKKVCMDCNSLLRDVAKSLILTIQCPSCGKEIQVAQD